MEPMHFTEAERLRLLDVARTSIEWYLNTSEGPELDLTAEPSALTEEAACFVTLKKNGELRGCIGHLAATQPLLLDAAKNAIAAATQDFRFSRVDLNELPEISISISVLSERKPVNIYSESELEALLSKDKCGLILNYRSTSATFLPSVWESIRTPQQFITQLKRKAGLEDDFWSEQLRFQIYHTCQISQKP